ncbi:hypothetical protein ACFYTQ_31355 [Nocardia sp. NPDC004068]|uniref:hypothetical protein n=1 Tax=Nocardia sp. NPDC004068 TaxID=3364303 RepID=UPI0036A5069F
MPVAVLMASLLQLALAGLFVVMLAAFRSAGPRAQRAMEAEVARRGVPPEALAEHGIRMDEGPGAFVAGGSIAAVLVVLAVLDLSGAGIGRVSSWVVEPLVLLGVGFVTGMQVFATRITVSAFAELDDPRLRALDIGAVLRAGVDALPSWYRPAIVARWLLATAGSAAVILLLALPSAGRYFS